MTAVTWRVALHRCARNSRRLPFLSSSKLTWFRFAIHTEFCCRPFRPMIPWLKPRGVALRTYCRIVATRRDTAWLLNFRRPSPAAIYISREAYSRGEMYSGDDRLCVCLSLAEFPHYSTHADVTWEWSGCPLVVQLLGAFAISARGFSCYDNIVPNAKCQRVLVLALCLVVYCVCRALLLYVYRHMTPLFFYLAAVSMYTACITWLTVTAERACFVNAR